MIDTIVIDAGHGGIDPNGKYTTAPKKMFTFDNGVTAYEGVINMEMAKIAEVYLKKLGLKVKYTRKKDDYRDMSLQQRVKIANDTPNSMLWSIHNNAGGGKGSEVFTTKGNTKSDIVAQCIAYGLKYGLPNVRLRSDSSDGDLDKEADFYVLRKTKGVAVLTESHFFDVWSEFQKLQDKNHLHRIIWLMCCGIFNGVNILNVREGMIPKP